MTLKVNYDHEHGRRNRTKELPITPSWKSRMFRSKSNVRPMYIRSGRETILFRTYINSDMANCCDFRKGLLVYCMWISFIYHWFVCYSIQTKRPGVELVSMEYFCGQNLCFLLKPKIGWYQNIRFQQTSFSLKPNEFRLRPITFTAKSIQSNSPVK